MASSSIPDWKPHLGRKVSVRYRLDEPDHPFSEAIGVISSVETHTDGVQILSVLTRRGETRAVPVRDIVASRLFPL